MPFAVFTRELDAGSAYPPALAVLGLEIVAMPVTRCEPPPDPTALARALAREHQRGGYAAIIVASTRAASALIAARDTSQLPVGELGDVWAVGPATVRALTAAGIAAIHPETSHDAASLARAILASRDLAGKRVLVPRAEDGREELIAILRDAGAVIDDVIAYRTVATPAADRSLARGRQLLDPRGAHTQPRDEARPVVAVCVVFSPSQVAALSAVIGPLSAIVVRFVAIGETTAAALRAAGAVDPAVAASPTPQGLAKAIAAVYPARR